MPESFKYLCGMAVLLLGTPATTAAEKPTVNWYHTAFPPIFITDGPLKGLGYGDKTLAYFIDRMPSFNHKVTVSVLARTLTAMKGRDGVCHPSLIKTPDRESFIEFSDLVYPILANQLITLKSILPKIQNAINKQGEINLDQILARPDLNFGVVASRVYSATINQKIDTFTDVSHRILMPHDRYAHLLLRGRIHYAFGFPAEAHHQFSLLGQDNSFITIPAENEPLLIEGYYGCSNKPLGQRVTLKINDIIKSAGSKPAFWKYYEEWLDANALKTLNKLR